MTVKRFTESLEIPVKINKNIFVVYEKKKKMTKNSFKLSGLNKLIDGCVIT